MHDPSKTNQELVEENTLLKQRIKELEQSEAACKRANDVLRESEEKYRILLSESPDPTFSFTPEGQYRYVNRAFAEGVGKPIEDIIGKSIWDVFPKDEADERFASLSQVFHTGDEKVIEVRVPRVDGDRCYMTTITPVKDTRGKILSAVCSSKDITNRKQAEEKSQNMLNFLQILINTIPSPIFRKDIHGRYQGCNKEFENYTGLRREEIIGKSVYDIYPKDVADKYHEMDLALFREPGRQIYEYPIIYADGKRYDVVVNKATYFNADGTLGGLVGVMVDITERKQAEFRREAALEELRESEAKFRLLFNSGKDYVAVHLMGKDGQPTNFVQVNDAACEKLGYTREEMLNLSPQDIDAADSSGRMRELIEKLLENKQVLFETEMISKNGHRIPMEVSVGLFQLNDNQATMCVARDITERKQVEQELANRLIFQQTLIDTIPHPIFFKNEVGRFVGCNHAYEREFGITRDYMIGKTVLDLEYLSIDERQRFQDEDVMVIREAGRKSYEMPIVYADGQTHITLYSVDGFALADGNPGGLIGMLVDITERKNIEIALQESENKYRTVVDNALEAIAISQDQRFVFVNRAATEIMGYPEEIIKTRPFTDFIHPDDRDMVVSNHIKRLMGENVPSAYSFRGIRQDGEIRWVEIKVANISWNGKPANLDFFTDITERKRVEEALLESEQRFRAIADYTPEWESWVGPDGKLAWVNPSVYDLTGYSIEECMNMRDYPALIAHEADRERMMRVFNSSIQGSIGKNVEFRIHCKGGDIKWAEVSWQPIYDKCGASLGHRASIRDITIRKQAEVALERNLTLYRGLIETTDTGFVILDQDGKVINANQEYVRLSGHEDFGRISNRHVIEWTADYEKEKNGEAVGRCLREGQIKNLEIDYVNDQGEITPIELNATVLKIDGAIQIMTLCRDITGRKQAEDELAKYRKGLEQLVEERTQDLENKTKTLEEVNIALKVLLQHREEDKKELEDRFVMNVKNMIIPFAEKMKNTNLDERQLAYLGIIETHLKDITSSMIKKFNQFNLTPAEVEVASLIKEGKATKEIAKIIGIATSTIDTHRNNIRKKLGISQEAVNLRSHLQSFN